MKKQNFIGGGKCPIYSAPTVETLEFSAEHGFAASLTYEEIYAGEDDGLLGDRNDYPIPF